MSTLKNVLLDRPGIVFEHVWPDNSVTQLVCLDGKIYDRVIVNSQLFNNWSICNNIIMLQNVFFKRSDPQPTDLPKIEDEGLSGQALIDALKANPNVKYYYVKTGVCILYNGKEFRKKLTNDFWEVIGTGTILDRFEGFKFVRIDDQNLDPIKLLNDNPDVVFVTKILPNCKYRWHDFKIEWCDLGNHKWSSYPCSNNTFRDFVKNLGGLIKYDSQEDLKKKLEAVKLPENWELIDNNCLLSKDGDILSIDAKLQQCIAKKVVNLQNELHLVKTQLELINIIVEHN